MDPIQIQFIVERRYLQCIAELSQRKDISIDEARESARALIASRPFLSLTDAQNKAEFIATKYPKFKDIYIHISALIREQETKNVVDKMHTHLQNDDIDAALHIAMNHYGDR